MKDLRIPIVIDEPKKAFLWDLDVFLISLLGCFIGILTKQFVVSVSLTFFLAWRWGKLKSGKHQWFFLYALNWFLPFNLDKSDQSGRIPETQKREFLK